MAVARALDADVLFVADGSSDSDDHLAAAVAIARIPVPVRGTAARRGIAS